MINNAAHCIVDADSKLICSALRTHIRIRNRDRIDKLPNPNTVKRCVNNIIQCTNARSEIVTIASDVARFNDR